MSFLCIRAAEFPVQALLSLRPEMREQAVAVLEHEPPLQRVCAVNARAFEEGVRHGMTRVEMENIDGIATLRRSLPEERSSREAMMGILSQFTPRLEVMSSNYVCCIVLDLEGTDRLIGAPMVVATQIRNQLMGLQIETAFCVSGDVPTALTLARTLRGGSKPLIVSIGQERAILAPLPLSAIEPTPEQAETFARWGIRTLGQLAALPLSELIARLGQSAERLHQLATGTHAHLFRPMTAIFTLEAHAAFEDAIELIDSLLFVLGPMLDRLIALAAAKSLALLSVKLTLQLDKAADHMLSLRPALPSMDRKFLLRLLQLELAAHPPAAAVVALQLTAEPAAPSREQGGLFSPQLPDASRLDVTLARIQSIVGEGNAGCAQLKDTHAPESYAVMPFQVKPSAVVSIPPLPPNVPLTQRTACRRLRPPWPARVSHEASRPAFVVCEHQRFNVKHAYGPWRSSGDWWNGDTWAREEWEVILRAENTPVPLHALLVHDLVAQVWCVEGMYD